MVPNSKVTAELTPFALTDPFSVALVLATFVAALVVAVGGVGSVVNVRSVPSLVPPELVLSTRK